MADPHHGLVTELDAGDSAGGMFDNPPFAPWGGSGSPEWGK
jgi:hypothetical protein